jgi:hypothetical protein
MTDKASRGVGGWVVSVTTLARDEREPHVTLFDVAIFEPSKAIEAVKLACGASSSAVAIKTHLSHGALALMRLKQGELRMRKGFKRPRDINQLAKRIVDIATGEEEDRQPTPEEEGKDPAAVSLGRRGGLKGGKARAAALSAKRRAEIAKKAAATRWQSKRG